LFTTFSFISELAHSRISHNLLNLIAVKKKKKKKKKKK
jgi:hypothetical protein